MISTFRIIFLILFATLLTLSAQAWATDFEIIKERVVAELMETLSDDKSVAAILARMKKDGCFGDINYADLSRTAGFPHWRHTADLVYLAKAYKNKKSKYYKSNNLKDRIIASLKY